jgi:hypothetical protein
MRIKSNNTSAASIPYLLLLAGAAAWLVWFVPRTFVTGPDGRVGFVLFDDAMISMRYARNLVEGRGLVWNPGQFIEGYTDPLWTLVMALAIALFGPERAPLAIQLLGAGCVAASVVLAAAIGGRLARLGGLDPVAQRIVTFGAGALLLAYYPFSYWAVMGMEVGPITVLALATALLVAARWGRAVSPRAGLALTACCPLLYGLRPDAVLIPLVLLGARWIHAWVVKDRASLATLTGVAIVSATVMLGHAVWRHAYYGAWTPNTYLMKVVGDPLSHRIRNGLAFERPYFKQAGLWFVLAVFTAWRTRATLIAPLLLGAWIVQLVYQVYVGGDPWAYWRQLTPGFALCAPLVALGLYHVGRTRRSLAIALAAAGVFAVNIPFAKQIIGRDPPYQVDHNIRAYRLAEFLRDHMPADEEVAMIWAGALPYYWPGPAYDMLGKTNVEVARLPADQHYPDWRGMPGIVGHNRHAVRRTITERRPGFVELASWGPNDDASVEVARSYVDLAAYGQYGFLRRDLLAGLGAPKRSK